MKVAIVGLALLLTVARTNAKPLNWIEEMREKAQCGPNERFTYCGTACPRTCDDVRHPDYNKQCTMECVIGCQCEPGYVLNEENRCVMKSHCPIIPGPTVEEILERLSQT
ncbi:hypothetical protein M514_03048, partial [Trichuris suis]